MNEALPSAAARVVRVGRYGSDHERHESLKRIVNRADIRSMPSKRLTIYPVVNELYDLRDLSV